MPVPGAKPGAGLCLSGRCWQRGGGAKKSLTFADRQRMLYLLLFYSTVQSEKEASYFGVLSPAGAAQTAAEYAQPQSRPNCGDLLWCNHPYRDAASHAALGQPGRTVRRSDHLSVHRYLGLLCHRPDPGGYLGPLDPVWPGGDPGHDPAGWAGLYDGHHLGVLCPPAADRTFRAAHHGVHPEPQ